jgi:hypothetical protein
MMALTGVEPVIGLFDAGITDDFITGEDDVDEETRSLTRIVCGAGLVLLMPTAGVNGFAAIAGSIGFAASDDDIDDIADTAESGWAIFAESTFFSVSSTSAATHPAPVSVVLMVSRETPSFICALIYSTIDSCTILLIFYFLNNGSTFYFFIAAKAPACHIPAAKQNDLYASYYRTIRTLWR